MSDTNDVRLAAKVKKTLEESAALVAAAEAMIEKNAPLLDFASKEHLMISGKDARTSFVENAASASEIARGGRLSRLVAKRGRI